MRELTTTYPGAWLKAAAVALLLFWLPNSAVAQYPLVKKIQIKEAPLSMAFEVTGKAPVKVIRISDKEVLVALKNVVLDKGFRVEGKNSPVLDSVSVERLDGNVVAVVLVSKKEYGKIASSFNGSNTRLTVKLGQAEKIALVPPKPVKPAAAGTTVPQPPAALPKLSQRCRHP